MLATNWFSWPGRPGSTSIKIRHDPRNTESVLAMLERCIDTPHTPETRQSILTTLFAPASQFLCDGRIQAQDLLSWISQRTSSGLTSE